MSPSPTTIAGNTLRVAFALLLPLYVRYTNPLYIFFHNLLALACSLLFVHFGSGSFDRGLGTAGLIALVWSWCANAIADFALVGEEEWKCLLFAYAVAWDAVSRLLPDDISVFMVYRYMIGHLGFDDNGLGSIVGPKSVAGVFTLLFTRGSLNSAGLFALLFRGLLIWSVIVVLLQRSGIRFTIRLTFSPRTGEENEQDHSKSESLEEAIKKTIINFTTVYEQLRIRSKKLYSTFLSTIREKLVGYFVTVKSTSAAVHLSGNGDVKIRAEDNDAEAGSSG
jgi:hypothetical protein